MVRAGHTGETTWGLLNHSGGLICGIVFLTYLEAWALLRYLEASDIFVTGMRL